MLAISPKNEHALNRLPTNKSSKKLLPNNGSSRKRVIVQTTCAIKKKRNEIKNKKPIFFIK